LRNDNLTGFYNVVFINNRNYDVVDSSFIEYLFSIQEIKLSL